MAFDVLKYNKISDQLLQTSNPGIVGMPSGPVIGLDRDGIINIIPEEGYVKTPSDLRIYDGVLDAIKIMRSKNYKVTIITDQPFIAKGFITPVEVDIVNQRLMEIFGQAGIMSIEGLYYNTSSYSKEDMYAKPNLGMMQRAEKEMPGVDFSRGYYVGDTMTDLKMAIRAKARPVLIRTGCGEDTEEQLNKFTNKEIKKKARIYSSLLEFANDLD